MSLANCIPGMVKRGEIDRTRAARMTALFTELEEFYRRTMGPDAAAAEASEATLRQLAAEARLKKRQTLLQANRQREAVKDLDRFKGDIYKGLEALLDDNDRASFRGGNVAMKARSIKFRSFRQLRDFLNTHRRRMTGAPLDDAGLDDVMRELHGQATGNAKAKVFAEAVAAVNEELRLRFNAAGGQIRKLDGYGMAHGHDALKVGAAGKDVWTNRAMGLLNRSRMIDDRTGVAFDDAGLRQLLGEVWETIRKGGLSGEPSAAVKGGKVANRRQEHRVLHFRDGDAWLEYAAEFGAGQNPFERIVAHISGMASDIAMMERLGPNPSATMRYLLDYADKQSPQAVAGRTDGRRKVERLWDYMTGKTSIPVAPDNRLLEKTARGIQFARNVATAAKMGSAVISASTDVFTGAQARRFYGTAAGKFPLIPTMQSAMGYINQLRPGQRRFAEQLLGDMEDATQSLRGLKRFYDDAHAGNVDGVLADGVLRLSLINKWTEAGQRAMGLDLLGTLGRNTERNWEKLPDGLRVAMERSGLDRADWDAIRQTPVIQNGGSRYVDPNAVRDRGVVGAAGAADRLAEFVLRARAGAVIETSATSRSVMAFGQNPNSLPGELVRSALQFKGFAAAMMIKQWRMFLATEGAMNRSVFAARYFVGLTAFGAITLQLRELIKGNDPRPMDTWEFWGAAVLQGGGLGIFGDLLGSFESDRVSSGLEAAFGPIGGLGTDLYRAGKTAFLDDEQADGSVREANPGAAGLYLARRWLPGTNLWYGRAAFSRMIFDELDSLANPAHDEVVRREYRRLHRNEQGSWWGPDAMLPTRAPDWGNAAPERDYDGERIAPN